MGAANSFSKASWKSEYTFQEVLEAACNSHAALEQQYISPIQFRKRK
jgi:hypothetical protein